VEVRAQHAHYYFWRRTGFSWRRGRLSKAKKSSKKAQKNKQNSAAAAAAAGTEAALASALSICEEGDALSSQLAASLAAADARGPRGRLRALLSRRREAAERRAAEEAELSSLRGTREPQLRAALEACEALASEVAAAELKAKEVAARLPGARQLLTSRNAERARLRERKRAAAAAAAAAGAGGGGSGRGGFGGQFLQQRRGNTTTNNNNNIEGWH